MVTKVAQFISHSDLPPTLFPNIQQPNMYVPLSNLTIPIVFSIMYVTFYTGKRLPLTSVGEKFPIDFAEGFFVNNSIRAFLKRRRKMEPLASFLMIPTQSSLKKSIV